ncbi:hypothetical protein [Glycomyces algeriensis]|nr:hypothetical protein [Glycomyces algeriensis]MDA1368229.1 hypothetical protein [Glycomyces algeriensis]MDR7351869.1 putative membrane protein [Glycomyces algeriensis]
MAFTARRTFNSRRALAAATAVAAVAATTVFTTQFASAAETDVAAAQACTLETLPIPEGLFQSAKVTGMSRDGSVIAYQAEPFDYSDPETGLRHYPLLYAGGEVTEVPMPGEWQEIADVNSKGVGAGFAFVNDVPLPYVWRDGTLTRLLGGQGFAYGINESGDIVGQVYNKDTGVTHPTVWRAGTTNPVRLALPENAQWGAATAIANDGRIIGTITLEGDHSGDTKPYIWSSSGVGRMLPMPAGVSLADADAHPMEINGDWVSGTLHAPGVDAPGIRWNLAKGTVEMTGLGQSEETVAIGPDGTVVGHVWNAPTAAYQTGATVYELPGLIDAADNLNYDNAEAISADGTLIAGWAVSGYEGGREMHQAVTWTCA